MGTPNAAVRQPGRAGYAVTWLCGHDEIVYFEGPRLDAAEREALVLHVASHKCPDCRR